MLSSNCTGSWKANSKNWLIQEENIALQAIFLSKKIDVRKFRIEFSDSMENFFRFSLSLFAFPFLYFCEMQSRSYEATTLWQAADTRKVWNFLTILPVVVYSCQCYLIMHDEATKRCQCCTRHSNEKENSVYSINIGQDGLDNKIEKLKIEFVNWIDIILTLFTII